MQIKDQGVGVMHDFSSKAPRIATLASPDDTSRLIREMTSTSSGNPQTSPPSSSDEFTNCAKRDFLELDEHKWWRKSHSLPQTFSRALPLGQTASTQCCPDAADAKTKRDNPWKRVCCIRRNDSGWNWISSLSTVAVSQVGAAPQGAKWSVSIYRCPVCFGC